jgi:hypothetical protein
MIKVHKVYVANSGHSEDKFRAALEAKLNEIEGVGEEVVTISIVDGGNAQHHAAYIATRSK